MTSVDEIMAAIGRQGDDCIRDADSASESFDTLREMIASALADARRDGADAMRAAAGDAAQRAAGRGLSASAVHLCIRALPTGGRQAVLLTRQQIDDVMTQHYPLESLLRENVDAFEAAVRDVESAVLAANNLEVRRG